MSLSSSILPVLRNIINWTLDYHILFDPMGPEEVKVPSLRETNGVVPEFVTHLYLCDLFLLH